jgi:hypothetical protein
MADGAGCEPYRYKQVIVAIHGIGSQRRGDTIRSVADRFGARRDPPLPVMPLGHFHVGMEGEVHVSRLDTDDKDLKDVGFAEVFWADIPRGVAAKNDTLEDTKAWGRSVISRARSEYMNRLHAPVVVENPKEDNAVDALPKLDEGDFDLGTGVIEEIVETLAVLENLLAVADRAGVFKFEIGQLLRDYIGDVQLVAEFQRYRDRIVYRFHDAMEQIVRRFGKDATTEVYIVAHSEGTVVSLLALLDALTRPTVTNPDAAGQEIDTGWIRRVRGFMTIGSPIDKHIVLWPKMWNGFDAHGKPPRVPDRAIRWRNYYDYGDPIGFRLETAQELLHERGFTAFDFEVEKHDHGFSRYWLPGKAHTDYWQDKHVFDHFIDEVVLAKPDIARPASYWWIGFVSTALPYAFVILLHVLAVFVLSKVAADGDTVLTKELAVQVAVLSSLLAGVTFAARLPRLVRRTRALWWGVALVVLGVFALPMFYLPHAAAIELAYWVPYYKPDPREAEAFGKLVVLAPAAFVAVIPWFLPRRPRLARRVLVGGGALVLGYVVVRLAIDPRIPAWPAVLGGAAFLYLWWLAILLFDLTFVWHRYIRHSVAVSTLRRCYKKHGAAPDVVDETKPGESRPLESQEGGPKPAVPS